MGFPIAAVTLPGSNNVQVFVGGISPAVTLSQTGSSSTNGLDSAWSGTSPFAMSTQSGQTDYGCIAACEDHNGQANLWAMPTVGHTLMTCRKTSSSAQWSQPTAFNPQPPGSSVFSALAAGKSDPGRIQLFAAVTGGGSSSLITTWETEENSGVYYDWIPMEGAPTLAALPAVACVNAPGGRLQLLATNSQGNLMTCWKSKPEKDAPWTAWQKAGQGPAANSAAGGITSSGPIQMWAASESPEILSAEIASPPSANIAWANAFLSQGAVIGQPYSVATARLGSGHLIAFLAAGVTNHPGKYALYATLDTGSPGWVHLANLN